MPVCSSQRYTDRPRPSDRGAQLSVDAIHSFTFLRSRTLSCRHNGDGPPAHRNGPNHFLKGDMDEVKIVCALTRHIQALSIRTGPDTAGPPADLDPAPYAYLSIRIAHDRHLIRPSESDIQGVTHDGEMVRAPTHCELPQQRVVRNIKGIDLVATGVGAPDSSAIGRYLNKGGMLSDLHCHNNTLSF